MPKGCYERKHDLRAKLLDRVERVPGFDCWLFCGKIGGAGYGRLPAGNKRELQAHRVSYETFKGSIPAGMHVCHACDVPCCVNPDHLWLGDHTDNMQDMANKGRASPPPSRSGPSHHCGKRTHCPKGHPYSAENTYVLKRPDGSEYRYCRICRTQNKADQRRRRKQQISPSLLV